MNCPEARPFFSAYLDRELPQPENAEVALHALSCPACQKDLRSLLQVRTLLRQLPVLSMPGDLKQTIRQATAAPGSGGFSQALRWWVPPLALAGALGVWLLWQARHTTPRSLTLESLVAEHRQYEYGAPLAKQEMLAWRRAKDAASKDSER